MYSSERTFMLAPCLKLVRVVSSHRLARIIQPTSVRDKLVRRELLRAKVLLGYIASRRRDRSRVQEATFEFNMLFGHCETPEDRTNKHMPLTLSQRRHDLTSKLQHRP